MMGSQLERFLLTLRGGMAQTLCYGMLCYVQGRPLGSALQPLAESGSPASRSGFHIVLVAAGGTGGAPIAGVAGGSG